jgi:hypothetical protein
MGLDAWLRVTVPEETELDVDTLREEATIWLLGRFGGTNGMFCLPFVMHGDKPGEFIVSVRVSRWGMYLEAAGHEVGDIHCVLAAWVFNRFDPEEGLEVEAFSG